ncbi:phosphatidylinositide phosphatase SAC1-like [Tropilaelaps mercedesae]|uniref:Phosphatidylinositol-3-phosphatase SAC1 n=1 Tax=Tropilaelaps mercedesae TaxID=418985 RepID=A0A1V9X7J9_9ACAR|nr:phosphatidylinositide phosphatase SAC1-like [Tropilaelaps mercedesae]
MGNPNIRYEPFDFHVECKGMRYDRLKILIDRIADSMEAFNFYMELNDESTQGAVRSRQQTGVFRTNCIDCLDRTNVVQSLIARRSLVDQLMAHQAISSLSELDGDSELENTLRLIWADNGDICSVQYAGTGALKADYTRTGKRTMLGVARDGWRSAVRYIKNNFFDGQRQDAIELILGNHRLDEIDARRQLSRPQLPPDVFLAPLVLAVLVFLLPLLVILGPSREQATTLLFFIVLLWAPSVAFLCFKIKANRMLYIDKPRWLKPIAPVVHDSFRH